MRYRYLQIPPVRVQQRFRRQKARRKRKVEVRQVVQLVVEERKKRRRIIMQRQWKRVTKKLNPWIRLVSPKIKYSIQKKKFLMRGFLSI